MEVKGVIVVPDGPGRLLSGGFPRLLVSEHVANRPIVHHVLDALVAAGVSEVVVACATAAAEDIRRCLGTARASKRVRLSFVHQPGGPLDIAGALALAAPQIKGDPAIVHLANGLLAEPLRPLMDRYLDGAPDVVVTVNQGPGPGEHLNTATQDMLRVVGLDPERDAFGMAGVCLLGPGALSEAAAARWRAGDEVDLTRLADRVSAAGGVFRVLPVGGWRRYAGDPLDLLELNRIVLDGLESEPHRPTINGNRIEGRVWIHEDATVRSTVIVGPAVIGAEANIADAYIGPYTSIGPRVRVEGAEIERSIIASGASVTHVGGRLVSSVVGRDARIFRDFSLPRALRLRVGDGTEVALC